jgi:hypothetical protein
LCDTLPRCQVENIGLDINVQFTTQFTETACTWQLILAFDQTHQTFIETEYWEETHKFICTDALHHPTRYMHADEVHKNVKTDKLRNYIVKYIM